MAGALKKTMIYLGLADGDDEELDRAPASSEAREPMAHAAPAEPRRAAEVEPEPETAPAPPRVVEVERVAPLPTSGSTAAPDVSEPAPEPRRPPRPESSDEGYRAPVTPIKRAAASSAEGAPVRSLSTVHPRSYNDAKTIGEAFRSGMPVIMNVTELGENEAKRLVDFAAGLVFGLNGSISRITSKVFLLTPATVEVVGDEASENGESGALYDGD